ncbi:unnamed protein product [Periconia digitata]|uniref:Uncharacterized protein n=1 Tax=Periconia digitata TaxID=1303443 RepID=A0A9W4U7P0_9PLEO|nr:unnamed protein product [Periconia digitata]
MEPHRSLARTRRINPSRPLCPWLLYPSGQRAHFLQRRSNTNNNNNESIIHLVSTTSSHCKTVLTTLNSLSHQPSTIEQSIILSIYCYIYANTLHPLPSRFYPSPLYLTLPP